MAKRGRDANGLGKPKRKVAGSPPKKKGRVRERDPFEINSLSQLTLVGSDDVDTEDRGVDIAIVHSGFA